MSRGGARGLSRHKGWMSRGLFAKVRGPRVREKGRGMEGEGRDETSSCNGI